MDLKAELKSRFNLKESDFDYYESDLYVRKVEGIVNFLKEKKIYFTFFRNNIKPFEIWIDLTFHNTYFWKRKIKGKDHGNN